MTGRCIRVVERYVSVSRLSASRSPWGFGGNGSHAAQCCNAWLAEWEEGINERHYLCIVHYHSRS